MDLGPFLLMFAQISFAQPSFTRIKTGAIAKDNEESVGCAWVGVDSDGFIDLYVTNFDFFGLGETNALYHNNQDGTFTRLTGGDQLYQGGSSHGCAFGDYNNDGFPDLFVAYLSTTNGLYRNIGNGEFKRDYTEPIGTDHLNHAVSASWVDYDVDGDLDLFLAKGALVEITTNALYRNLGQNRFENVAESSGLNQVFSSLQAAWADADGDGLPDLFVTHYDNQRNLFYHNLGNGRFEITPNSALNERMNSIGAAWGDFDNDGDLDLFVTNHRYNGPRQRNALYRNNSRLEFEKITTGNVVTDSGQFHGCVWADFDNDGFLDLFVVSEGSKNFLYHNSRDGTFTKVTQGAIVNDIANGVGCATGDYDNDGFLDLFVANGALSGKQPNFLYHNDGNSNHWIKVRCVGTISNRSAIGTIVRAKTSIQGDVHWQMRQISGGECYLSQNSLDVSIGFGSATRIELLRIEWPSGFVQELRDVGVDQTIVIEEPSRIQSLTRLDHAVELTLKGGGRDARGLPRSYDMETSSDLLTWTPWTTVVVTNIDGTAIIRDAAPGNPERFYRAKRSVTQ